MTFARVAVGWFSLACLLLSAQPSAQAARVTLQHGHHNYSGAADTWLNEAAGNQRANYGGAPSLCVRYDANDGGFAEDCMLLRFALPHLVYNALSNAVLELFYFEAGSMWNNNAVGIKPYRVHPSKNWYENNRNGEIGEGASWVYFQQVETPTNEWTSQCGGWFDKIDDGNGSNLIKKTGGTVPGAIEPTNWVPFNVAPSVQQWLNGATNNGFILFTCSFQGTGSDAYGIFASRETNRPAVRPRLRLQFAGAHVVWTGLYGQAWDTVSTNWSVGGLPGCYDDGDYVWFTDATSQTNILVVDTRYPGSVTISNSTRSLVLGGGSLAGPMTLTKLGTEICQLGSSNGYTGTTTVRAGTLCLATNGALGATTGSTIVESNGTLCLLGGCNYTAGEPLILDGTLASLGTEATWGGPLQFSSHARIRVDSALLNVNADLSGTGAVRVGGTGMLRFAGEGTSSWTGTLAIQNGSVQLDRAAGPVLYGDIFVGTAGAATLLVARAGQLTESCTIEVNTNSWLAFAATGATYTLTRLHLRAGAVDSGPALVTLADTVTARAAAAPSRLQGSYFLASTSIVFQTAQEGAGDHLIINGSLIGGGVEKTDFGNLVLAGANMPTATWRVVHGILTVAHPQGLGTVPIWVNTNCTLQLAANTVYANSLILQGALYAVPPAQSAVWAGDITLGSGQYILGALPGACLILDVDLNAPTARLSIRGGGEVKWWRTSNHGHGTEITGTVVSVYNFTGSAFGTGLVSLWAGSVLAGTGVVACPVIAHDGAGIYPGVEEGGLGASARVGTLIISNNLTFRSNAVFTVAQSATTHGRIELHNGGIVSIDSNAVFTVDGTLFGTNPVVIVSGARDIKGTFRDLPSGTALPPPNQNWHIHYQPNAVYLGLNSNAVWYFRAVVDEGRALVSWRTPVELDVAGFDLYREEGGHWHKANDTLIPAEYPAGGVYTFFDPAVPPGSTHRYRLVQVLSHGLSNVLTTCERTFTSLEFKGRLDPDAEKTLLRWRSREDEIYRIERLGELEGPIENTWGSIPATPDENIYTVPLPTTQGFYRIVWEP